jgi:hypothetical protein
VLVDYRTHLTSLTWTEDPNFKDDCLTAIIQSVSLTTGLSIEPDVARALFRDIRRPADSTSVLDEAIATVPRVARAFCERHRVTSAQRTVIIGHAAADLFMLARVNRRRHAAALRTAIMMVREHRAIGLWLDPMFVARLGYCALNGMWWMMRPRR